MIDTIQHRSRGGQHRSRGGLLKAGAWSAVAAALAVMALPSAALAQDRGGRHWSNGGGAAQAQSRGGNGGRVWGGHRGGDHDRHATRSIRSSRNDAHIRRAPNGDGRRWTSDEVRNGAAQRAALAQRMRVEQMQRSQAREVERERTNDRRRVDRRDWRYSNDARPGNDNRWTNNRWSSDSDRWNRDWRRNDRYDWHSYRSSNRNVYRIGRYYAPYRNYYYRPLGIGFLLDTGFFGSRYWINDPWHYRLPRAYGPYRWIRYFDDALLVDIRSGEVLDVINDFFW